MLKSAVDNGFAIGESLEDSPQTRISMAEATASDAVLPKRPGPALSMMDLPSFPEGDRVDRSDLHEVP